MTKWDDTPSTSPRSEISSVSSVSLESLIESPVKKYIQAGKNVSPTVEYRAGVKNTKSKTPKSISQLKDIAKEKVSHVCVEVVELTVERLTNTNTSIE